jgi:hypothetical protein
MRWLLVALLLLAAPLAAQDADKAPKKPPLKTPAEIADRIDQLIADIDSGISHREIDALVEPFREIEPLLKRYRKEAEGEKAKARLRKWEKILEEWREIRLAVRLQIALTDANELLRALLLAKNEGRIEDARKIFEDVKKLVTEMRLEERDEFARNAEAIATRAKALLDEAEKDAAAKPKPEPKKGER